MPDDPAEMRLSVAEITELKRLLGKLLTAQEIAFPDDWYTRVGRL